MVMELYLSAKGVVRCFSYAPIVVLPQLKPSDVCGWYAQPRGGGERGCRMISVSSAPQACLLCRSHFSKHMHLSQLL